MALDPTIALGYNPPQTNFLQNAATGIGLAATAQGIAASRQQVAASQTEQANIAAQLPSYQAKAANDVRDLMIKRFTGQHLSEITQPSPGNPDGTPAGTPFKDGSDGVSNGAPAVINYPAAMALYKSIGAEDAVPAIAKEFATSTQQAISTASSQQDYNQKLYDSGKGIAASIGASVDAAPEGQKVATAQRLTAGAQKLFGYAVVNDNTNPVPTTEEEASQNAKTAMEGVIPPATIQQIKQNQEQIDISKQNLGLTAAATQMSIGNLNDTALQQQNLQKQAYNAADATQRLVNAGARFEGGLWVARFANDQDTMLANAGISDWKAQNPNVAVPQTPGGWSQALNQLGDQHLIRYSVLHDTALKAHGFLPQAGQPGSPPGAPTPAPTAPAPQPRLQTPTANNPTTITTPTNMVNAQGQILRGVKPEHYQQAIREGYSIQ